ncbi:MAG: fimbrillin family protein [Bacteroidales bacterium]|nr:fimbrillin family protein [Bacteroidales bacterium]
MKRYIILFAAISVSFISCSKIKELESPVETEWIRFSSGDGVVASGAVETKTQMENEITCTITDWEYADDSQKAETKAKLKETISGKAGVFGYNYSSSMSGSDKPVVMCNMECTIENGNITPVSRVLWRNCDKNIVRFYAYEPYGKFTTSGADVGGVPYLSFTVPTDNKEQCDILYSVSGEIPNTNRESVPLQFKHAMTAVRFSLAIDNATLKSVKISNIKSTGRLSLDGTWSELSGKSDYSVAHTDSLLLMIPQTLGSDATISLTYNDGSDHTISASLSGQKWEPGKKVIYTLKDKEKPINYIYFDIALGDVKITASGYSGKINVGNGTRSDKTVSGAHSDNNRYYIYQSVTDTGHDALAYCEEALTKNTGYISQSAWDSGQAPRIPVYEADIFGKTHKKGGEYASIPDWGKYITNNTSPYEVYDNWRNGDQNYGSGNRLYICGPSSGSSVFDITVDRIFLRDGTVDSGIDDTGMISIGHDGSGFKNYFSEKVTLRLKNNNMVTRIHYRKPLDVTTDSYLKITSADGDGVAKGTLTVTPRTDKATESGTPFKTCKALTLIGAANNAGGSGKEEEYDDDRGKYHRQVKDLYFDGGIVYVGAPKYEGSWWKSGNKSLLSLIGGVNSWSEITINGGVLTAVSNNTCSAIGGGGGWESEGGRGVVTINGGTVYAYSFGVLGTYDNELTVIAPPAIGGGSTLGAYIEEGKYIPADAGSCDVKINGGNVYACSVGGPAIGGGSAGRHGAGKCVFEMTGGNVVAKSLAGTIGDFSVPATNAIGGGRSGMIDGDGGSAEVILKGGMLYAGSVGGGLVDERNLTGRIGSADIRIIGGTTNAQFIMAKGTASDPKFKMTGGSIMGSNTSDTEYAKVRPYGGAVYIETGDCSIEGGSIMNCSAKQGGAVYMDGGTFSISGGYISDCIGREDGGAVYIKGGNATVSGGQIKHNIAANGNGGGVYVSGGNFIMPKNGNGEILNNAADCSLTMVGDTYYGGNGGGIYVRSVDKDVSVDILGGKVQYNAADRNGGGLCVDMEGSAKKALITIGNVGGVYTDPDIQYNSAALSGGGMAVQGTGSNIVINSGTVKGNVSAFVKNEDIRNDGGAVDLVGKNIPGQTPQVDVKYNTIKFYANNGVDPEPYDEQRVITSTNSPLHPTEAALAFEKEFYHISHWNTKRDGTGTSYQLNGSGAVMNITADISLYAQWVKNQ